jgi:peptidoglycan/xylan/chitin deacetylase (PgdA/CDA1 family)/predicted O-methyltransferase YrrM
MPWVIVIVVVGAAVLAHTAPFPFILDWTHPGTAVWEMPRASEPTVYLTFDDGPNPTATPLLLDVLARQHARATFFVIDRHLTAETAPIVRRMFEEGHAVGLHSHTRKLMVMGPGGLANTIAAAADRMERLTGYRPCPAFRPHAGWRSHMMMRGLARRGFRLFGWGWLLWDAEPFRRRTPERLVPRLASRAGAGSIVVMHDGHHENPRADRQYTVQTVEQLVPRLRAKGLTFGTVCQPLADRPPLHRMAPAAATDAHIVRVAGQDQPARTPDIHFVPTRQADVDAMLRLAHVSADDVVFDLGSGDGRVVVIAAQKYGARGVGIELQPDLVRMSRELAREGQVADKVTFIEGDLFEADLSGATVVTLYLSPSINRRLLPKLRRELRPGTRIVSHQFRLGDWIPDETVRTNDGTDLYLWVVPPR